MYCVKEDLHTSSRTLLYQVADMPISQSRGWPHRLRKLVDAREELEAANHLAEKHVADVEEGLHRGSRLLLLIKADLDHMHRHSRCAGLGYIIKGYKS